MKTTVAACLVVALWFAAATASHAAEQGAVDAKDKTNSWVGWAYHKFTQSMGNKASQGKDVVQDTSNSAKHQTEQPIKMAETTQSQASDKMSGAMAYGKEKASNVQDRTEDAMHKASDKLESAYKSAKEKAGMNEGGDDEVSYEDMSQHAKESYEAAKERASQVAGDMGEKMREGKSEL